jgi:hypothetical protein
MSGAVIGLTRRTSSSAASGSAPRILRWALQLLGRLAVPSRETDDAELPSAFYKYPPV